MKKIPKTIEKWAKKSYNILYGVLLPKKYKK